MARGTIFALFFCSLGVSIGYNLIKHFIAIYAQGGQGKQGVGGSSSLVFTGI